jgi:preprotein translocase subunit SecE
MASEADKTLSEEKSRRPRRRATTEATGTERPRRRLGRGKPEPVVDEKALVGKGRATPSRRAADEEEETGNAVTRRVGGLREYFVGVGAELRKVTWPSAEDLRRLTIIVMITLVATALALGLISFTFTELFRLGLANPIILIVFMAVAIGIGLGFSRMSARRSNS